MTHCELNQICNIEAAARRILKECSEFKDAMCLGRDTRTETRIRIIKNQAQCGILSAVKWLTEDGYESDTIVFEECKRCEKPQNECDCE